MGGGSLEELIPQIVDLLWVHWESIQNMVERVQREEVIGALIFVMQAEAHHALITVISSLEAT